MSAVIYCLRAMVDQDIPLNQGCLVPINVILPPGSCLNPSETAAVVGGNVCTSQRVTDVVLRAFDACAASQGDCCNLTYGNGGKDEHGNHVPGFGFYETIGGGTGAGPSWSGVTCHSHMTNTRITDPGTASASDTPGRERLADVQVGQRRWSGGTPSSCASFPFAKVRLLIGCAPAIAEFELDTGSGGRGLYNGGDGIVRDIEFVESASLPQILTAFR